MITPIPTNPLCCHCGRRIVWMAQPPARSHNLRIPDRAPCWEHTKPGTCTQPAPWPLIQAQPSGDTYQVAEILEHQ